MRARFHSQMDEPSEPEPKGDSASVETSEELDPASVMAREKPAPAKETPMDEVDRWIADMTQAGGDCVLACEGPFVFFLVWRQNTAWRQKTSVATR